VSRFTNVIALAQYVASIKPPPKRVARAAAGGLAARGALVAYLRSL